MELSEYESYQEDSDELDIEELRSDNTRAGESGSGVIANALKRVEFDTVRVPEFLGSLLTSGRGAASSSPTADVGAAAGAAGATGATGAGDAEDSGTGSALRGRPI